MQFFFVISLLVYTSLGTSVSHHTFSITEDADRWVYFPLEDIDKITSITWYKEMHHILYPPKDYEPFVYFTRDATHQLPPEGPIGLNAKEVPEFWTHNKAYILVAKDGMKYDVVILVNTHTTVRPVVATTGVLLTGEDITGEPTTEEDITGEPTTEEPTIETTNPQTTPMETTPTETTNPQTTPMETTNPQPTPIENTHNIKAANTPAAVSSSSSPQNGQTHKGVAIILVSAFATLFVIVLVVVTARTSSSSSNKNNKKNDDFFEREDDFVVVDEKEEDTREKDMQILMALGKGAKPAFQANF